MVPLCGPAVEGCSLTSSCSPSHSNKQTNKQSKIAASHAPPLRTAEVEAPYPYPYLADGDSKNIFFLSPVSSSLSRFFRSHYCTIQFVCLDLLFLGERDIQFLFWKFKGKTPGLAAISLSSFPSTKKKNRLKYAEEAGWRQSN